MFRAFNPRQGWYCGAAQPPATGRCRPKRNLNGYGLLTFHVNETTDLFADLAVGGARITNNTRAPTWTSARSYSQPDHRQPGKLVPPLCARNRWPAANANRFLENSWSFNVGARGQIGDSGWDYEAVYSRSRYEPHPPPGAAGRYHEYLLGPKLGVRNGVRSMRRIRRACSTAEPERVPEPVRLPGEPQRGVAADLQRQRQRPAVRTARWRRCAGRGGRAGSQGYRNRPDPRLGTGEFWNTSAGVGAGGERDRYAAGVELQLPLLQSLTTTLAGRYDQYRAGGEHIGKATWSFGVEFRPIEPADPWYRCHQLPGAGHELRVRDRDAWLQPGHDRLLALPHRRPVV